MQKSVIKVLHIGKFYYPYRGGIETFLYNLCTYLKDKIDVQVLVANTHFNTIVEYVDGVKVTRAACAGVFLSTPLCPSFLKYIYSSDADIIHIHSPNPMAEISFLTFASMKRLIVSYHSDIIRQRKAVFLYSPIQKRFLKRADRIVVATPNHIKSSPLLNIFSEKCKVISYGIDLNRFKITPNIGKIISEITIKYRKPILLFVGRLVYYKGVEYLIKAMQKIEARLLIAGSGPEEKRLKILADQLGISEKCIFLGEVTEEYLISLYHASDLLVLPSVEKTEAFGIVQLEAFACKKPVISTNLPSGVPYVNQDGKTGFVVQPREPEALSNAILTLLSNREMRDIMGENGRLRVENEFTVDKMGEGYLKLYKELIESKNGTRNIS